MLVVGGEVQGIEGVGEGVDDIVRVGFLDVEEGGKVLVGGDWWKWSRECEWPVKGEEGRQ